MFMLPPHGIGVGWARARGMLRAVLEPSVELCNDLECFRDILSMYMLGPQSGLGMRIVISML